VNESAFLGAFFMFITRLIARSNVIHLCLKLTDFPIRVCYYSRAAAKAVYSETFMNNIDHPPSIKGEK